MIMALLVAPLLVAFVLRGRRARVAKREGMAPRYAMSPGAERRHGPGSSRGASAGGM